MLGGGEEFPSVAPSAEGTKRKRVVSGFVSPVRDPFK